MNFAYHPLKFGIAAAASAVGIAYKYSHQNSIPTTSMNLVRTESHPFDIPATKKIFPANVGPRTSLDVLYFKMFQYVTCPFCCKLRAYLMYRGIPCDVVEVNSVRRRELMWSTQSTVAIDYKKVPQLIVALSQPASLPSASEKLDDFVHLKDSTVIISALESYFIRRNRSVSYAKSKDELSELTDLLSYYTYVPASKDAKAYFENSYQIMYGEPMPKEIQKKRNREMRWREWVDSVFVHYISPNVYRSPKESLAAFRYFCEVGDWDSLFSKWDKYLIVYSGTVVMYLVGIWLRGKYGLKPDVRESLYDGARQWTKEVGDKPFMGGDCPDLSDLAMYGVLTSFEGCQAFADLMRNCPKLERWFQRVSEACTQHHGADVCQLMG